MAIDLEERGDEKASFRELAAERLRKVEGELENIKRQLESLQDQEDELSEEAVHLRALTPSTWEKRKKAVGRPELDGRSAADMVVELLEETGRAMHFRDIARELQERGEISLGGQNPANALLARYFNDERVYRPRRGTYDLRSRNPSARSVGTRRKRR